jgi:hypothetical protein
MSKDIVGTTGILSRHDCTIFAKSRSGTWKVEWSRSDRLLCRGIAQPHWICCDKTAYKAVPFGTPYFASDLHRRSIFLREKRVGLSSFAILASNKSGAFWRVILILKSALLLGKMSNNSSPSNLLLFSFASFPSFPDISQLCEMGLHDFA